MNSRIGVQTVVVLATVLVLCSTATDASGGNTCPSSQPCERYSVQFFFKTNWQRAAQYCGSQGMRLASILSEADQAAISYQIEDLGLQNEEFWVSGNSLLNAKYAFSWVDGRPLKYTNWATGEPNGNGAAGEECITLKSQGAKWNDTTCSASKYFVCERV